MCMCIYSWMIVHIQILRWTNVHRKKAKVWLTIFCIPYTGFMIEMSQIWICIIRVLGTKCSLVGHFLSEHSLSLVELTRVSPSTRLVRSQNDSLLFFCESVRVPPDFIPRSLWICLDVILSYFRFQFWIIYGLFILIEEGIPKFVPLARLSFGLVVDRRASICFKVAQTPLYPSPDPFGLFSSILLTQSLESTSHFTMT